MSVASTSTTEDLQIYTRSSVALKGHVMAGVLMSIALMHMRVAAGA